MATEAQVSANRSNAAKSTGPKTTQGKAVVAQNAIKHGLLARQNVIMGEDQQEFDLHRGEFLDELAPAGTMETFLAERIVSLTWRLRRAERVQNEVFDSLLAQELKESMRAFLDELSPKDEERLRRDPGTDPTYAVGRMIAKDYLNAMVLDRLQMYERRIEHSLCRIIKELRTLRLEPRLKGGDDAARGAAAGSVRAEGFGDGCIPSEPDHRLAETQNVASLRSDGATDAVVSDCVKQSQSGEEVSSVKCEVSSGADSAKQSQSRGSATGTGTLPRCVRRAAWHSHNVPRSY